MCVASSRQLSGHGRFLPSKDNLSWGSRGWDMAQDAFLTCVLSLRTLVSTTLNLALVGGDILCEDFSPLYIWV